jgi:hypothetical protein
MKRWNALEVEIKRALFIAGSFWAAFHVLAVVLAFFPDGFGALAAVAVVDGTFLLIAAMYALSTRLFPTNSSEKGDDRV